MRQEAVVAILHHADRTGALGQLLAFLVEDHRQVRELRHLGTERVIDVDLPRRVVDVVVAADHFSDAHVDIVDHHGEVVGRPAVGTEDHQIVQLVVRPLDAALDLVVEHHRAFARIAETDHAMGIFTERLVAVAVIAVVARLLALRDRGLAHGLDLRLALVGVVRLAGSHQFIGHLLVTIQPLGLVKRTFIGIQTKPVHGIENRLHRGIGRALAIGILDAQDEFAAATARFQPAVQCSAGAADMQETGGAGSEAGADGHGVFKRCGASHGF